MKNFFLLVYTIINFFIFTEICLSIEIPSIIFTFQQPTYLFNQDTNLTQFNCIQPDCKVNFNLENSFSWFTKSQYLCVNDFWFITWEENKCNPNTITFWTWIFNINFKIFEKLNESNFKEKTIVVTNQKNLILEKEIENSWSVLVENNNSWSFIEENFESCNSWILLEDNINYLTWFFLSTWSLSLESINEIFLTWISFSWNLNLNTNIFYNTWENVFSLTGSYFSWNLINWWFNFENLDENLVYFYQVNLIENSWSIIDFFTWSFITNFITNEELMLSWNIDKIWELENINETNIQTWLILPEIILTFQSPSYIILKNWTLNEYYCNNSKDECKINFNLENSFTWNFIKNNYLCEIYFWSWFITWEEDKCNPNTITFWTWIFNVNFKILDKNNPLNFIQKEVVIYNDFSNKNVNLENFTQIPEPIISIQSWLDSNYKCLKRECIINLTAEESFANFSGSLFSCLWSFSWGTFSSANTINSCNPWYVYYWIWVFDVNLRIFEKWNESNFKEKTITIANDNSSLQQSSTTNITYFSNLENQNNSWSIINENTDKTLETIKAQIILQWSINWTTKKIEWKNIICITKEKCNLNFIAFKNENTKVKYLWDFWNWTKEEIFNPKSIYYEIWEYEIILKVIDEKWNEDSDYFLIQILWFTEKSVQKIDENQDKKEILKDKNQNKEKDLNKELNEESENENKLNEKNNIEEKLNYEIFVQWKMWNDKKIEWNKIYCTTKKQCSINFWIKWDKQKKSLIYLWDFWNDNNFIWFNPNSIIYELWSYNILLQILDLNNNVLDTKEFFVIVKNITVSKNKKSSNLLLNSINKIIPTSFGLENKTNNKSKEINKEQSKDIKTILNKKIGLSDNDIILSWIGLSIFVLSWIYILIKKYLII